MGSWKTIQWKVNSKEEIKKSELWWLYIEFLAHLVLIKSMTSRHARDVVTVQFTITIDLNRISKGERLGASRIQIFWRLKPVTLIQCNIKVATAPGFTNTSQRLQHHVFLDSIVQTRFSDLILKPDLTLFQRSCGSGRRLKISRAVCQPPGQRHVDHRRSQEVGRTQLHQGIQGSGEGDSAIYTETKHWDTRHCA